MNGPRAFNHAVEIDTNLVDFARERLEALGHTKVKLHNFCMFTLDLDNSMRFSRIYAGAGLSQEHAADIASLLEVGGVMVAPVAAYDESQSLVSIHRTHEYEYHVESLMSVQFVPFLPCPRHADDDGNLPESFKICPPAWEPQSHSSFVREHRDMVRAVLMLQERQDNLFAMLPKEIWIV